eukprot:gene8346-9028_t
MKSILILSLLILFLQILQGYNVTESWEDLKTLSPLSLFSVHAKSANDVFAAIVDKEKGSFISYSYNGGESWETLQTKGNNYAMAMSPSGKTLCAVGTKSYCANATNSEWEIYELDFHSQTRDVQVVNDEGFAMVGSFTDINGAVVNGVAYLKDFQHHWSLMDIQLDRSKGYFAMRGSFPSASTWFVTSGSWPIDSPLTANTLSGKLSMIASGGNSFFNYKYEFHTLSITPNHRYVGAISKTTDGGKNWEKVFDSNNEFYFNQMDCIIGGEICIAIGEGPEKTVVLKTIDGGLSWDIIFTLNPSYSLHACAILSPTTFYVGGGMVISDIHGQHNITGMYFKTVDGGEDWSMTTGAGYVYDFSFVNENVGYAATIFNDYCRISKLTKELKEI